MNAVPSDLLRQAEQLSADVTRPIPGSRKIHVQGSRADLRVPMREIVQTPTPTLFGGEDNPPVTVYDCSGPYSDPDACIDLAAGLAPLRADWIAERGDSSVLPGNWKSRPDSVSNMRPGSASSPASAQLPRSKASPQNRRSRHR